MALTADREVVHYTSQELIEVPLDDNVKVYKGALVGHHRATGYARPLQAGDAFLGVAYAQADNTGEGHAAGAVRVRLYQSVDLVQALSGVTEDDIGKAVYAGDDETLTLSPTGNSRVGRVVAVEGAGTARVRCQPAVSLTGVLENLPVRVLPDADAALTLDHMNRVLLVPNTAVRTLTLPPAAQVRSGGWVRVIKTTAAAAGVVLDGYGDETINGAATFGDVDAQYDAVLLVCTGDGWVVAGRDVA